jgi:DeoR family transcriptional regulator of aga operon
VIGRARRERIAAEIDTRGFMSVGEVAERFNCSIATARRDLTSLAESGRVNRAHGGALAVDAHRADRDGAVSDPHDPIGEAKRRIGRAAAAEVRDGDSVGLSGGTTVLEVARSLRGRKVGLVTNAVDTALELAAAPGARVVLLGGVLDYSWGREIVGPLVSVMLDHLQIDTVFASVDGISAESGLTVISELEAQVMRAMAARARRLIVVADHTKIGRTSLTTLAPVGAVNLLVTDAFGTSAELDRIRRAGVRVLEV